MADLGLIYADCEDGYLQTASVASFKPNGWGLYEMSGNVWEWVADYHHDSYHGAPSNGDAWQTDKGDCGKRSGRGGGWLGRPGDLRSAYRIWIVPDGVGTRGFRLARTL
jgi:formylglycine-generating enzyme required for sulfatase activity